MGGGGSWRGMQLGPGDIRYLFFFALGCRHILNPHLDTEVKAKKQLLFQEHPKFLALDFLPPSDPDGAASVVGYRPGHLLVPLTRLPGVGRNSGC